MGTFEDLSPNEIEERFNLVGLRDYEGSLVGENVVPNGSTDPKEEFGHGYDLTMIHKDLKVNEPYGNTVYPMIVKDDFVSEDRRFLKVEDKEGNQADVLAERLILA